jgi:hypothetical protein
MAYTFSTELVSDLHKDAFGYRPSAEFMDMWHNGLSDKGRQAEWDYMIRALNESMEEEKVREQYALESFEDRLTLIRQTHSFTEEEALGVMTYQEKQDGRMVNSQDAEHWVWGKGILFTDRGRAVVQMLKRIYGMKY